MYITSINITFIILLITLAGCQTPSVTTKKSELHLAGGWYAAEMNEDVKQAALFARKELNKEQYNIQAIEDIQQQIVAGINYQFTMLLADKSTYHITVYYDLEKQFHLVQSTRINE